MLNNKQQVFCEEYLADLNGTRAALRAGYSKSSARQIASHLLALPDVKDSIGQLIRNRAGQAEILQYATMKKLWDIANEDIKEYLSFGPKKVMVTDPHTGAQTEQDMGMQVTFKDSESVDTRNITEISLKKNGDFKFKLASREKALEILARRLDTLSRFPADDYTHRETIEPIFLIPEKYEKDPEFD